MVLILKYFKIKLFLLSFTVRFRTTLPFFADTGRLLLGVKYKEIDQISLLTSDNQIERQQMCQSDNDNPLQAKSA